MTTVANIECKEIDFDAAVELMDDDIREDMSSNYAPGFNDPQEFFSEYVRRHAAKFDGEEFAVN